MRTRNVSLLALMFGLGGFGVYFMVMLCFFGIIGMFAWPYGINTWLIFAGKPPCIVWWQGFLIGMVPFFGAWSVVFAIITWILMLFIM